MKTIHTHPGKPHLDDMASCALLHMLGEPCQVVRTREAAEADYHVDVGGSYNPSKGEFDHHQWKWKSGEGEFIRGVPCSSFGLVCKEFLPQVCVRLGASEKDCSRVLLDLVGPIDAADTGFGYISSKHLEDLVAEAEHEKPVQYKDRLTVSSLWNVLIPPISEDGVQDADSGFYRGMAAATTLINGVILSPTTHCDEWERTTAMLVDTYFAPSFSEYVYALTRDQSLVRSQLGKGQPIQVFDRYYMGLENSCTADKDLLYILFPDEMGWKVRAVSAAPNSFTSRKALPSDWRAKDNKTLIELTGVKDAVFCHGTGFIAGAMSLEGAMDMARQAVSHA